MKRTISNVYAKELSTGVDWREVKRMVIEKSEHGRARDHANNRLESLRFHNKTILEFSRIRVLKSSDPESRFGIHEVFVAYIDWLAACTPPQDVDPCLSDFVEMLLKQHLNKMCGASSRGMWVGWTIIYPHFRFDSTAIRNKTSNPISLLWDHAVDQLRIVDQDEKGLPNSTHNWTLILPDDDTFTVNMTRVIVLGDTSNTYVWRCSTFSSNGMYAGIGSDPNIHAAKKKSVANFMARYESRTSPEARVRYVRALKEVLAKTEAKHAKHATTGAKTVKFAFLPPAKPVAHVVLKPIVVDYARKLVK